MSNERNTPMRKPNRVASLTPQQKEAYDAHTAVHELFIDLIAKAPTPQTGKFLIDVRHQFSLHAEKMNEKKGLKSR
jgi:hypothetical protein